MTDLVAPDAQQVSDILDASFSIWNDGLDRRAYERWYDGQRSTPWGRAHLRRVALTEGDRVTASAKLYELSAACDGRPIRLLGIGAVFTQPPFRGRGLAPRLIASIERDARAAGVDALLLFSEIGAAYYERLGFETIPTVDLRLRVIESSRRGAPAVLVRAGDDRDVDAIVAMDAARAEGARWHVRRDRDLVQFAIVKKRLLAALSPPGVRSLQFFVAEEGAAAVAYVVIAVAAGASPEWTIDSCGDRDPAGARVGAILQALVARDPGGARPSIGAWLPPAFQPPQIAVVDRQPAREVMMLKWLDRARRPEPPLTSEDVVIWRADAF
jgi:predicted N-acetyltransferase YhbS